MKNTFALICFKCSFTPQNAFSLTLIQFLRGFTCSKRFHFIFLFFFQNFLSVPSIVQLLVSCQEKFLFFCKAKNNFKRHLKGGNRTSKQKTTDDMFAVLSDESCLMWSSEIICVPCISALFVLMPASSRCFKWGRGW